MDKKYVQLLQNYMQKMQDGKMTEATVSVEEGDQTFTIKLTPISKGPTKWQGGTIIERPQVTGFTAMITAENTRHIAGSPVLSGTGEDIISQIENEMQHMVRVRDARQAGQDVSGIVSEHREQVFAAKRFKAGKKDSSEITDEIAPK